MLIIVATVLLAGGVILANVCAWALLIMPGTFHRLNYSAPIAAWTSGAIGLSVWLLDNEAQARVKVTLIVILLVFINAAITHVTARATRVRDKKHWPLHLEEPIPVAGAAAGAPLHREDETSPGEAG
jgi:multisubunit Na+/H+ antiporter MnhG subunit